MASTRRLILGMPYQIQCARDEPTALLFSHDQHDIVAHALPQHVEELSRQVILAPLSFDRIL
eukprot:10801467-Ditylum_brightwellii.AAC.1